jgi:RNA polymerase sigma factor (sigma-70 family)
LPHANSPHPSDESLVVQACTGDKAALEALLRRHQSWLYNVALRLFQVREDAEDATQEVLIRIATHLSSFRGHSAFRTWAYRIAVNHFLDRKRSKAEEAVHDFACYAGYLEQAADGDLQGCASEQERHVLVEEARLSCMIGMLLCFSREQRLVFILGEILDVGDAVGAEAMGLSNANFRQQLHRAREQLNAFLGERCGLVNPLNPCRCARKTAAFVKDGIVDPQRRVFVAPHLAKVREAAPEKVRTFNATVEQSRLALYGEHPFYSGPDLATKLMAMIDGPSFEQVFQL